MCDFRYLVKNSDRNIGFKALFRASNIQWKDQKY